MNFSAPSGRSAPVYAGKVLAIALATHDGLTGLPNRVLFFDVLDRAVALARRHEWEVAVLVDVDGFKDCNDRFGHRAGDELLVETAQELSQAVRESDVVARPGGDEVAIPLAGDTSAHEAGGGGRHELFDAATSTPRAGATHLHAR